MSIEAMEGTVPIDSKREEFRKYLEKAGAMDALTKVLVMLYDEPEKPADALDYIRKHLGDTRPDEKEVEVLKADFEAATMKIQALEDEIKVLKEKIHKYEPEEDKSQMDEDQVPVDTSEHVEPSSSTSAPTEAGAAAQAEAGAEENIPHTQ